MWFVTLALLIVAAYFLFDALREKTHHEAPHELASTRRESTSPTHIHNPTYQRTDRTPGDATVTTAGTATAGGNATTQSSSDGTLSGGGAAGAGALGALAIGGSRFKDALAETVSDVKSKRHSSTHSSNDGESSNKLAPTDRVNSAKTAVSTGAIRCWECVTETVSAAKAKAQKEHSVKSSNPKEPVKQTVTLGANRFKESVGEALGDAKKRKAKLSSQRSTTGDGSQTPRDFNGDLDRDLDGLLGELTGTTSTSSGTIPHVKGQLRFLDKPDGQKDDLTRISGVGPVIQESLNSMGVYHFHQIANFGQSDVDNVNTELDFAGRIERDDWIPQARSLAAGSASTSGSSESSGKAATVATGVVAAAVGAATARGDSGGSVTAGDYTGAWNSELLVEICERMKVMNLRDSDAPRLKITTSQYHAIRRGDTGNLDNTALTSLLERLRALD